MRHYASLEDISLPDCWLTIGSFDGVHLGHQTVLRQLVDGAHQARLPAVALTFFPHPSVVLQKRTGAIYLTTPQERAELMGSLGVDYVITHPFTPELAATSAWDFIRLVHTQLQFTRLCVGYDFALGRKREGTVEVLGELGKEFGYTQHIFPPVTNGEAVVSSSLIRQALLTGDLAQASRLLGRPYSLQGKVVHGDGRGRLIGIPTANLALWHERVIPKPGVYACLANVDDQERSAVCNIGVRPTFDHQSDSLQVEAHILDFDQDLYGKTLRLQFVARLRDEQRFPGVQALVEQIHSDIHQARKLLAAPVPHD